MIYETRTTRNERWLVQRDRKKDYVMESKERIQSSLQYPTVGECNNNDVRGKDVRKVVEPLFAKMLDSSISGLVSCFFCCYKWFFAFA